MKRFISTCAILAIFIPIAHGQDSYRQKVADGIASLEKDQSRIVDLVGLTGRDFGVRPSLWKAWLRQASNEDLVRIIERQSRAGELDKMWHQFALAFADANFARIRGQANEQQAAQEKLMKITVQSKDASAWIAFVNGCESLRASSEAANVAIHFRKVFREMPLSHYANTSDELAFFLEKMSQEEKTWAEPNDPNQLNRLEKLGYYVYHLRHIQVEQDSQPGRCHVVRGECWPEVELDAQGEIHIFLNKRMNAAVELKKIGKDTIPTLLELLDDRHPIRSIGRWRGYWPERTVLRYQDAAAQLLDELLPVPFFSEIRTDYLSTEAPQRRFQLIARVRKWHEECEGKPEAEQFWIAVKMEPGIYLKVELLKKLAREHDQREDVLKELHMMYGSMHQIYRPFLTEVMVGLGDPTHVGEVLQMLKKGEIRKFSSDFFPNDPNAPNYAQEAAKRLLEHYRVPVKKG